MKLSEEEKQDWLDTASSEKLREDFRQMEKNRHNPLMVDGQVDLDRLVAFLTEVNAAFGHQRKPFCKIIDRDMRL
ncbi:MAG: hypothetical protein HZA78_11025 [Candidatus Schekmanbacteria bacterium]|nr:hypothetical protein [Candidatus Schekmanbacteria bacterium]